MSQNCGSFQAVLFFLADSSRKKNRLKKTSNRNFETCKPALYVIYAVGLQPQIELASSDLKPVSSPLRHAADKLFT